MILRHGITVNRYIYADTSEVARQVIEHRLTMLSSRYPNQLPPAAWTGAFTTLPMDVHSISKQHLQQMVGPGEQWLLVAGWQCEDLSLAGSGKGLSGSKSSSYFKLISILHDLQDVADAAGCPPPAYMLENTAFQYHHNPDVCILDFATVCNELGTPVEIDAARFGSRAHRLRNFWTNLGTPVRVVGRTPGQQWAFIQSVAFCHPPV